MTQEEKAKAYDKAIERAMYWRKNPTIWSSDDICQKLFPELKESEDERISKVLIELVEEYKESSTYGGFGGLKWDKLIAWLEKQCK